ncbi:MAG: hypothetical protein IKB91_08840, partial [Anaerotignum sp.]|nr:hypothetical protein [Anaerotignum sp.]
ADARTTYATIHAIANQSSLRPIHGSAPDIAGQHKINPTACILSASLMLAHLGEAKAAAAIEKAVSEVISEGKTLTQDMGGTASTEEFADAVIAKL